MITVDTNILLYLLNPDTNPPADISTGRPVERCRDRIEFLISELSDSGAKLILPTPVLAELLVSCGPNGSKVLAFLSGHSVFKIVEFDQRAAIEFSQMMQQHWNGDLRKIREGFGRHRIKFDLQIIAIARVVSALEILTDDSDLKKIAAITEIQCRGIEGLPLPPEPVQASFRGI